MLANLTVALTMCCRFKRGVVDTGGKARAIYEAGLLGVGVVLGSILIFAEKKAGEATRQHYSTAWCPSYFGRRALWPRRAEICHFSDRLIAMWNEMHGRDPFIGGSIEQNA